MRRLPRVRRRKVRVTHQAGGAARRRPPSRGRSCGGGGLRPPPAASQRWKSLSKCPEPVRPGLGRRQTYPVLSSERADTWHTVPSADVGVGMPATERLRFGVFRMQRRVLPNGVHPCSLALQYFDGDEHLPATEGSPVVVPEAGADGQGHELSGVEPSHSSPLRGTLHHLHRTPDQSCAGPLRRHSWVAAESTAARCSWRATC